MNRSSIVLMSLSLGGTAERRAKPTAYGHGGRAQNHPGDHWSQAHPTH